MKAWHGLCLCASGCLGVSCCLPHVVCRLLCLMQMCFLLCKKCCVRMTKVLEVESQ